MYRRPRQRVRPAPERPRLVVPSGTLGRRLNDRAWSSPQARSAGLREFAFAQLGTAGKIDGRKFSRRVAQLIVVEIVPAALREVRKLVKDEKLGKRIDASIAKADAAAEKMSKLDPAYAAADAAAAAYAYAYAYAAAGSRSKYRDEMLGKIATIGVRALKEQLGDAMIVAPAA